MHLTNFCFEFCFEKFGYATVCVKQIEIKRNENKHSHFETHPEGTIESSKLGFNWPYKKTCMSSNLKFKNEFKP